MQLIQQLSQIALASAEELTGEILRIPYKTVAKSSNMELILSINGITKRYEFSPEGNSENTRELNAQLILKKVDMAQTGPGQYLKTKLIPPWRF